MLWSRPQEKVVTSTMQTTQSKAEAIDKSVSQRFVGEDSIQWSSVIFTGPDPGNGLSESAFHEFQLHPLNFARSKPDPNSVQGQSKLRPVREIGRASCRERME